jgi:hypothetical protein
MNADHPLITNLEDATRENDALREVLRLMGFDAQKCIKAVKAVNLPTGAFWHRAALGSIPSSINPEYLAAHGFCERAAVSLQAVFSSLRAQPQPASASARPAADLSI